MISADIKTVMLEVQLVRLEEISLHHELVHDLELKELLHYLAPCEGRSVLMYILWNPPTKIPQVLGP